MQNNSSHLEISKEFNCSKEKLYKAWTEPEQLKKWWRPMGKQLSNVTNNITQGGDVQYAFEDGSLTIDGTYEQVVEHNLLEYTWNWHVDSPHIEDAAYKLSVRFEGAENNSVLYITQSGFHNEESVHPHREGWEQGLEQLNDYVSKNDNDNSGSAVNQQKPPVSGYNETPEQQKVGGG